MSWYKSCLIIFLSLFVFLGCTNTQPSVNRKFFDAEDEYIVFALEYEKLKAYDKSIDIYMKLFHKTQRYEYLTRALMLHMENKKFTEIKKLASENLNVTSSEYENILRIYVVSLINLKEYDLAYKNAKTLLDTFNNSTNYEVLGNIYYLQKRYEEAAKHFESAYVANFSSKTLINLVNILYAYLDKKEEAISYLETHIRLYDDDLIVNYKLLSIYQEEKNIDGIISTLKKIYYQYKRDEDYVSMMKTNDILINYLEKKDINLAIDFLKSENNNPQKLLSLYKQTNQMKKALKIIKDIYKKTGDIELLAQIAILEFESAADKNSIISSVIEKFEEVLTVLDNHIYQNYLGYILIDYDIDVKKGLVYVNKALEKAPNNVAYLDSLAWGQYKLKDCKNAYINMKKVVDSIGSDDQEIKLHWNKIKECGK